MSAKDSQFIERALMHPWMFWVFFWKWPRILRQVCGEYDLVAKDRDAAKAAHEQAVAANEKVRKWIHVTHQLDATADLRAIWTAGKRLSILLVFFVVTNTVFGQAPPYLRNQWTTNANPLALKVISTNGVHAATNVWELDFTNTATVTVSAVSNANKVMVSFTGSASSGSSSLTNALLHAGPTNGSVGALVLTAGDGVTLTTSGTNRVASLTGAASGANAVTYDPTSFNVSPTNLNNLRASNITVVGNLYARTNVQFDGLTNTHWMRYTNGSLLLNQRRDETFYGQGDVNEFLTYFGAPWEQFKWFVAQDADLTPDQRGDIEGYWYSFSSTNSNKAFIAWFTDMRTIDNELASARFNLQSRSTGTNGLGIADMVIRTDVVPEDASQSQALLSLDSSLAGKQVQLQLRATPSDTADNAIINGTITGATNTRWINFLDASSRRFVLSNNFDLVTPGKIIGRDALGTNYWQISTNGQIKMGKFVDTIFVPGNELGIYDVRSKEGDGTFFTEWVAGIWEKNDGSGGRSTFKVDADLNDTNANFVNLELLTRRGAVNRTLSVRNAWDNSQVSLEGTFSLTLNGGDVGGGLILYSNSVSAKTFSLESNGTVRVMGDIGIYPFRSGVVFLPTPTARLQISNAPNFAIPLFRAQTNSSNGVMIESNGLLIAMSGFQLTSGTPGAGKVLTDVAGDGVGTWETASGGSGIASIFTNNVLAGGPGLTELEFTNSASVTWAATTNAGRVTMSASSAAGAQTPWTSDINAAAFSLTNFGTMLSFTNGSKIGATATNTLTLTNSHLVFATDNLWDIGASGATRPRNGYFGGFLRPGVGSASTPSLNFGTAGSGIYDGTGSGEVTIAQSSSRQFAFNSVGFYLISDSSAIIFGGSTDLRLTRPGAGRLAVGAATGGNTGTILTSNVLLSGSCVVTQSLANGVTAIALTADNQSVSATNRSYIQLSSDDGTAGNRTFVLSSGTVVGQLLDLEWTGTNAGEIVDDFSATGGGNGRLSATWTPTQYDVLALRWNGTDWIERSRSAN